MKMVHIMLLPVLLLLAGLSFTACGGDSAEQRHQHEASSDHAHGEGAAFTSAYVCPMHCEGSGSDQPGTCPVCGMDYQPQSEHMADGHSH